MKTTYPNKDKSTMRFLRCEPVKRLDAAECLRLLAHLHISNTTDKRELLWNRYCELTGVAHRFPRSVGRGVVELRDGEFRCNI